MKKKHLSLILFLVISTTLQAQEKGRITDSILALPDAIKNNYVESFDYPDTSIEDLVQVISKMTGKNFILDPKVSGKKDKHPKNKKNVLFQNLMIQSFVTG